VRTPETLLRHQAVWRSKAVLRALYRAWYEEIASYLRSGPTLEVGGGTGNLKEYAPQVICTDVVRVPWLDAVADAQRLPIATGTLANVVLFDVLHHIENVRLFFDEAVRVLQPGGRIVVMDPYISWLWISRRTRCSSSRPKPIGRLSTRTRPRRRCCSNAAMTPSADSTRNWTSWSTAGYPSSRTR